MSKSAADPRSRILITDDPAAISEKIRLALTDSTEGVSYEPSTRPGVSNLIELLVHFSPIPTLGDECRSCEDIATEFKDSSMRAFKEYVATAVAQAMEEVRDNYKELTETREGEEFVESVAMVGAGYAEESAAETLELARRATGLE